MNFFGHAVVASWCGASPAATLGAMLPDLCTMASVRPVRIGDPEVARGVDLHHATDAAFHRLDEFTSLCREASRSFRSRGLERGPALGAAHVGVELLLDGVLLDDADAARLYLDAIADRDAADAIILERDEHRFRHLRDRLEHRGIPEGYREPATVAEALVRILGRRPRLAVSERGAGILEAEMPGLRRRVEDRTPALLRDLRAALATFPAFASRSVAGPCRRFSGA